MRPIKVTAAHALQIVHLAIELVALEQTLMRIEAGHVTALHHEDAVAVLYC